MTNNKFQQHLERSSTYQLLSEDSPFYNESSRFLFVFTPEHRHDEELIEAEKSALAARFDSFTAHWAEKRVDKWEETTKKDSWDSRCGLEHFHPILRSEFSRKIDFIYLSSRDDVCLSREGVPYELRDPLNEEFRKLVFEKASKLLRTTKLDNEKQAREDYVKTNFPNACDPCANSDYRRWSYKYESDHQHHVHHTKDWLAKTLRNYKGDVVREHRQSLWSTHSTAEKDFENFSNYYMQDIVRISEYMASEKLTAKGKALKDSIPQTKHDAKNFDNNSFRPDLSVDHCESEIQKIFKRKVLSPISKLKKSLAKIQPSEDFASFEEARQVIIDKRLEQKRLEELEREKQRQEIIAQREAARLAREKELEECLDNFMIMLRDSGHGHGHKDREGSEKLWYGTEALAAKDALKLAKKSDRLLKPYRVTLCTEMDQPVHGWFLTSAVDSRETA